MTYTERTNPTQRLSKNGACKPDAMVIFTGPGLRNWKKQIEENARNYGDWQHRAERAEKIVNTVVEQLKANMVWKPENAWQLGYRAAIIAIVEVIRPPSGEGDAK